MSVDSPSYYQVEVNGTKLEVVDIISATTRRHRDGGVAYCIGSSLKYLFRAGLKGNMRDDLMKAKKFIEFAIQLLPEGTDENKENNH